VKNGILYFCGKSTFNKIMEFPVDDEKINFGFLLEGARADRASPASWAEEALPGHQNSHTMRMKSIYLYLQLNATRSQS